MMTRKHYQFFANQLRNLKPKLSEAEWSARVNDAVQLFKEDGNPNFDEQRFRHACEN